MIEKKGTNWWNDAGIPVEILGKQMPHINFVPSGNVVYKKLNSGYVLINGFAGGLGASEGYVCVYRFNSETQTAELLYFQGKGISSISTNSLMDRVEFNKYLSMIDGFRTLAPLMGIDQSAVENRFSEAKECNQILINRSPSEKNPKIRITFGVKDEAPPIRFIYDYSLDTDKAKLVYTNKDKWLEKQH